jgi:enoyl-CoA hydratase/carnithine racemase
MPTVALINGHAYAGGLFTALHHDYRIQNPSKGFLCLNEVHFGAIIPSPMVSIVKTKIGNRGAVRDLLLEGRRFDAKEALAQGIIDATGGLDETLAFIKQRNLTKLAEAGVYGAIKDDTYREHIAVLRSDADNVRWRKEIEEFKDRLAEERAKKVEGWDGSQRKGKL